MQHFNQHAVFLGEQGIVAFENRTNTVSKPGSLSVENMLIVLIFN
jgi:hypothetical protein